MMTNGRSFEKKRYFQEEQVPGLEQVQELQVQDPWFLLLFRPSCLQSYRLWSLRLFPPLSLRWKDTCC
jgi:hypothetical protein